MQPRCQRVGHSATPRLSPIDLDAVTLNYVPHRQFRPGKEQLALTRSNTPLDISEVRNTHVPQPDLQTVVRRKFYRRTEA
jgi:hypothetical protein